MNSYKIGTSEKIANGINYLLVFLLCVATVYPFWYVFMYSISDGIVSAAKPIVLLPVEPTLENYRAVFANTGLVRAFLVSVSRTVLGTASHIMVVGLAAYAMAKKGLVGKKLIMTFFIITMYFNGGLLPTYVIITKLKLTNNFLVYILPLLFSGFHMLIMKVFFEQLPASLEESAKIDGATDFLVFTRIIVPMCKPIVATVSLFIGVAHWNSWFDAFLYMTNVKLYPLQTILQKIILESQTNTLLEIMEAMNKQSNVTSEAIKMATVIVATVPILLVYPFMQKYFVKGMMIGAVKQ